MKKIRLDTDSTATDKEAEGTLLDVLHLACNELFPEIKRASSKRCALSIGRLLVGILSPSQKVSQRSHHKKI